MLQLILSVGQVWLDRSVDFHIGGKKNVCL